MFPPNNGYVITMSQIIKAVMSSAAEAELGALFVNVMEAVYMQKMIGEMGHKQAKTPMQTDNSMEEGLINKKIQPKCTKSMDMRFHWLQDRESQEQCHFSEGREHSIGEITGKIACTHP